MTDNLLQHIDLIAAAPDGVKRLRELILELAVRGKLVPQDPNDEPASKLLKRIQAEKARLAAEGKIKKDKPLPAISEEEQPFELPVGWEWVRLGDVANAQAGFAFKSNAFNEIGQGIPIIRIRDVGQPKSNTYYAGEYRPEFVVSAGDFLISMDGQFRVAQWQAENALLNQRVSRLLFFGEECDSQFIASSLQQRLFELQGIKAYTTVDHLSGKQIAESVIGLPPAEEQIRIVAKVDELITLCDQLEAQQTEDGKAHATLVKTMLDTLTAHNQASGRAGAARPDRFLKPVRSDSGAPSAPERMDDDFTGHWERIARHFDTLFTTEASIEALKQTILQLAVMGKLVTQNPDDEPASKLLKRIQAEKAKLIAEGKIRKDKPLPAIGEEEKPFELPAGWEWVRMQTIFDVRDGTHDTPKYVEADGVPLITSRNFQDGRICFDDTKLISWNDHNSIKQRSAVDRGDILYSMIGGNIGNQVMVDTDREFSIKNVALFKYYSDRYTPPEYLDIFLRTVTIGIQRTAIGGAQPFVSLGMLRNVIFSLPPLPEQHRIVAKVDELMALCDQLADRLKAARERSGQYATAATRSALEAA